MVCYVQPGGAVVEAIRASGGYAAGEEFDLGAAENIPRMFDLCEAEHGPVDILVNNHAHCVSETFDTAHELVTNVSYAASKHAVESYSPAGWRMHQ